MSMAENKLRTGPIGWWLLAPVLSRVNLAGLLFPLGVLVGLQVLAMMTGFQRDSVALPSEVLARLWEVIWNGEVFVLTWETLSAAFAGLAIGGTIGLILGVLFGAFPPSFYALELTTEFIRPMPSVSLLPIALLVFGFGFVMEISLIAKSTIWPVMVMTHAAILGLHPRLSEVSKLLGLNFVQHITKIVLPAIVSNVFVGFRLSMGVALLVAITVEIAANPRGLGYAMMRAQETLQPDLMFGLLFWVGLLGWAINAASLALENALFGNRIGRAS
ncbi:MAG: ABC transporter permease [Pelagimonas sp.]|uniref:ABC transporter permease n=1 Tax=Pelagimonas sp. TaxID=2073170 RepID=UPI003D6C5F0E